MADRARVEKILDEQGFGDCRWISGKEIRVAQWVRFKCMFGCDSFGKKGTCPPAIPSVLEAREFFSEYDHAVVIHFAVKVRHPDDRKEWSRKESLRLLALERAVFLAGFQKAFVLFMDECRICGDCSGTREACLQKKMARPGPEALGVDVFATVRSLGYPIEVLTDPRQEMNRYAFLMVE